MAECDQVFGLVEAKHIVSAVCVTKEEGGSVRTYEVSIRRSCELLFGICTSRRVWNQEKAAISNVATKQIRRTAYLVIGCSPTLG